MITLEQLLAEMQQINIEHRKRNLKQHYVGERSGRHFLDLGIRSMEIWPKPCHCDGRTLLHFGCRCDAGRCRVCKELIVLKEIKVPRKTTGAF
jgi:hypothetical protein